MHKYNGLLYPLLLILSLFTLTYNIKFNQPNHHKLKNNDLNAFRQTQLDKHNQLRKKHHSPPLKLDDHLNDVAQKWAEHLADIGKMIHSKGSYGENLYYVWASPPTDYKNGAATQSWYDQIKYYKFKKPGFSSKTGHFTQVIWKDSQKVGFGIATVDGKDFVVAQYDPPGNYVGKFPQNVLQI